MACAKSSRSQRGKVWPIYFLQIPETQPSELGNEEADPELEKLPQILPSAWGGAWGRSV